MLSELLQQISSRGLWTLLCARRWQVRLSILSSSFSFFTFSFSFLSFLVHTFTLVVRETYLIAPLNIQKMHIRWLLQVCTVAYSVLCEARRWKDLCDRGVH